MDNTISYKLSYYHHIHVRGLGLKACSDSIFHPLLGLAGFLLTSG
jgi:hypothetical protein